MSQLIHVLLSSLALALLGSVRTATIPPARQITDLVALARGGEGR